MKTWFPTSIASSCLILLSLSLAMGQTNPLPLPQFGLSADHALVVTGFGHEFQGLEIRSRSGSLVWSDDPSPFRYLQNQTSGRIQFGGLRPDGTRGVIVDGDVTLSAGWNPRIGGRDVEFRYSLVNADTDPNLETGQGISGRVNETGVFVVSGSGQAVVGLDFYSPAGNLIPVSPGTLETAAEPFEFFLANTATQVTLANLGSTVTIDGDLTLQVGYSGDDPGHDIYAQWGHGPTPVPFPIHGVTNVRQPNVNYDQHTRLDDTAYPPLANWPKIEVALNNEHHFVLHGVGQPIREFRLSSRNRALVPSEQTGPFASVTHNLTPDLNATFPSVVYRAEEEGEVVLDGALTLGTAWDPQRRRDVQFQYDLVGDANHYTGAVDASEYPFVPTCYDGRPWAGVGVRVDQRNQIVLQADGHALERVSLASANGGLVPGDSPHPFNTFDSQSAKQISMRNADGSSVTLDGSVTLSTAWNPAIGDQDLEASFAGVRLPNHAYPFCTEENVTRLPVSEPQRALFVGDYQSRGNLIGTYPSAGGPITVTTIRGPIHVAGISFFSDGGLVPAPSSDVGPSAEPFDFLLSNSPDSITYGNLGTTVTLEGSLTLTAGAEAGAIINANWGNGPSPIAFPVFAGELVESAPDGIQVCAGGSASAQVGISVNQQNQFVLRAAGHQLQSVSIASDVAGLIPGDTAFPFNDFESNSAERVTLTNKDAGPITLDGTIALGTEWNSKLGEPDVRVDFEIVGHPERIYPQCIDPRSRPDNQGPGPGVGGGDGLDGLIGSFPLEGGPITISAWGGPINVAGLDFTSSNGGLIPIPPGDNGPSSGPFSFLLSNTADQVTFGNLGTDVTIEGSLTLPVQAQPNAQITAAWGDGPSPVAFSVTSEGPIVPEPTSSRLGLLAGLAIAALRSHGRRRS